MKKIFFYSLVALIFIGCNDTKEAKLVESSNSTKAAVSKPSISAKEVKPFKPSLALKEAKENQKLTKEFYKVFNDGAKIAPSGKPIMLIFGQPNDPYTKKLKEDVVNNKELANKIKEVTTPIYINARANKMHKFMHNGELMDVDTKTLTSIYAIKATPTIIFLDTDAKSIFVVPGYMPPNQFIATLEFLNGGDWVGKDRKNGEVYEELKKFYIAKGIKIKAKK